MKTPVTAEFLFNYFAGHATALQKEMIDEWLKEPSHEDFFYTCLDQWERRKPQYLPDLTEPIITYQQFLNHDMAAATQASPRVNQPRQVRQLPWFRFVIAASVALVLGLGGWLYQDYLLNETYSTTYGEIRTISLPDGSQIILNANSTVKVPRFMYGDREVHLVGEAKFSIVHTIDHRRFTVRTGQNVSVEVLGTEFTVFSRSRGTKVVLTKGKVNVQHSTSAHRMTQVTMQPGDVVTLNGEGRLAKQKVIHPEDQAAWARQQFVFSNTSVQEICLMLQENYGIYIEITDQQIAQQTLTGSFHAQTADGLLEAISQILDLKIVRQDNRVLLTTHQYQ